MPPLPSKSAHAGPNASREYPVFGARPFTASAARAAAAGPVAAGFAAAAAAVIGAVRVGRGVGAVVVTAAVAGGAGGGGVAVASAVVVTGVGVAVVAGADGVGAAGVGLVVVVSAAWSVLGVDAGLAAPPMLSRTRPPTASPPAPRPVRFAGRDRARRTRAITPRTRRGRRAGRKGPSRPARYPCGVSPVLVDARPATSSSRSAADGTENAAGREPQLVGRLRVGGVGADRGEMSGSSRAGRARPGGRRSADAELLRARLESAAGDVVLSEVEEAAYQRTVTRLNSMWALGSDLDRFTY